MVASSWDLGDGGTALVGLLVVGLSLVLVVLHVGVEEADSATLQEAVVSV